MALVGPEVLVEGRANGGVDGFDVAGLTDGRYVVAWVNSDPATTDYGLRARIFNSDGSAASDEIPVSDPDDPNQQLIRVCELPSGAFVVAWTEGAFPGPAEVHARLFAADGSPTTGEIRLDTAANPFDLLDDLTVLADGRFLAVWEGREAGSSDEGQVYGRIFNPDGTANDPDGVAGPLTNEPFVIHAGGANAIRAEGLADGRFAAIWTQGVGPVFARVFASDGTPYDPDGAGPKTGEAFIVPEVLGPGVFNFSGDVAGLSDGRLVVAFNVLDGSAYSVHARIFEVDGTAGTQFLVSAAPGLLTTVPEVLGLPDGGFVVTLNQGDVNGDLRVLARVFNGDGTPFDPDGAGPATTGPFQVQTTETGRQFHGRAATLANGDYVLTWSSLDDGVHSPSALLAQVVDLSAGPPASPHITGTPGDDLGPDALLGTGAAEVVEGLPGNDELHGGGGSDTLIGGDGHDILEGGPGADWLDGSFPSQGDVASYAGAGAGVRASLTNPNANTGDAAGDRYLQISSLWGSVLADTLAGDNSENTLKGGQGDDLLSGYGDSDHLWGEGGNDRLLGQGGHDVLAGGAGDDSLSGGARGWDHFVFALGGGHDQILDWEEDVDRLDFRGTGLEFSDLVIEQQGGDVLVSYDYSASSVLIRNAVAFNITAADFLF